MWTRFMDMHSGGDQKLEWSKIFIEAPEEEAKIIFYNKFGRNPDRVTCTCCGPDYSTGMSSEESLEQITAYDRGCHYDNDLKKYVEKQATRFSFYEYRTLEEYLRYGDVKLVCAEDILPSDRVGELPEEGYVWQGGDE